MNAMKEYMNLKKSLKNKVENVREIVDNYYKIDYLIVSKSEYEELLINIQFAYLIASKRLRYLTK